MNAGTVHIGEFAYGAGQFALQGALVVDALNELRLSHLHGVKNFKAYALTYEIAFARNLDTHVIYGIGRNKYGGAVVFQTIGNLFGLEHVHNAVGVFRAEFGVQRPIIRSGDPQHEGCEDGEQQCGNADDGDTLNFAEPRPYVTGLVDGGLHMGVHGHAP